MVTRYDQDGLEQPDGEFVDYSNYFFLEAKVKKLEQEIADLAEEKDLEGLDL